MIKKQLAFIQDCIQHDNIHPLLSHIITYLDPKAVAQFLRCNKQLYYKPVLHLIWTQFITTPNTYTPHHLDLWKTLAIDRFRRDTPCEEDKKRLDSLLTEEKLALSLQSDYPNLVTDYQKKCNTYQHLQTLLSTRLDNNQPLDKNQEKQLVTLYHLHKQHFSCSDQDIFPEKAVSMTKGKSFNPDTLYEDIQTYINTKLGTEETELFDTLEENPEDNDATKTLHIQDIRTRLTHHPLLVFATITNGATPLHFAAQEGYTEVSQVLITDGATINATDKGDYTPLHMAAQNGNTEVAALVLTNGADLTAIDEDSDTPLHMAAHFGRTEIAELLLDAGKRTLEIEDFKNILNSKNNIGYTPLHIAASNGHTAIVTALLKHADKNPELLAVMLRATDIEEQTPLHLAANNGHTEIVTALLTQVDRNPELLSVILRATHTDRQTPLHLAAQNGHENIITCLITAGAEVNAIDKDGNTPLHLAALKGQAEILQALITAGADVNAINEDGNTPLQVAILSKDIDTVKVLLDKGANLDTKNNNGENPIYSAAMYQHIEVTKLLLDSGKKTLGIEDFKNILNSNNNVGYTPLHWAAINGSTTIAECLITAGADLNTTVTNSLYKGSTPLHLAVRNGHTTIARCLITAGADVNAPGTDGFWQGFTPLQFTKNDTLKALLQRFGAVA